MAEILDEIPDDDAGEVIKYSGGYESFLGSLVFGGFESDSDDGDDESSEDSDEPRDETTGDEQKEQLKKKKDLEESQSEESSSEESQSEESSSEESSSDELESELVEKEVELVSEFVGGQNKKNKKNKKQESSEVKRSADREAQQDESSPRQTDEYDSEFLDKPCGCSSEIVAEDQEDVVNSEFLSEDPDLGDKPVSVNKEKIEMLKELVNDKPDTSSEDELDSEYVKSEGQTQELNTEQTQKLNTKEPDIKESSDSDSESSSESDTGSVRITKELPKKQPKKGGNPTVFAALQSYLN